jgi:hypothetical protein
VTPSPLGSANVIIVAAGAAIEPGQLMGVPFAFEPLNQHAPL